MDEIHKTKARSSLILQSGYPVLYEKNTYTAFEHLSNAILGDALTKKKTSAVKGNRPKSLIAEIDSDIEYLFSQFRTDAVGNRSIKVFAKTFLAFHIWEKVLELEKQWKADKRQGINPALTNVKAKDLVKHFPELDAFKMLLRQELKHKKIIEVTGPGLDAMLMANKNTVLKLQNYAAKHKINLTLARIDIIREICKDKRYSEIIESLHKVVKGSLHKAMEDNGFKSIRHNIFKEFNVPDREGLKMKILGILGSEFERFCREKPVYYSYQA